MVVDAARHTTALQTVLCGSTSTGKGTSLNHVKSVLNLAAPTWYGKGLLSGVNSSEMLIDLINERQSAIYIETEWARLMKSKGRDSCTLGEVTRDAWDGSVLQTHSRGSGSVEARDYHLSFLSHITCEELGAVMAKNNVDLYNGFANRHLWVFTERAKVIAYPKAVPREVLADLGARLGSAIEDAARIEEMRLSDDVRQQWSGWYEMKSYEKNPIGAITGRFAPQTLRLGMIYALLDGCDEIGPAHLAAAVAAWEYCEASAIRIFADGAEHSYADPRVKKLQAALIASGANGLSRTDLSVLFSGKVNATELSSLAEMLIDDGTATIRIIPTGGRVREVMYHCHYAPDEDAVAAEEEEVAASAEVGA
jgi:hypothetical protein